MKRKGEKNTICGAIVHETIRSVHTGRQTGTYLHYIVAPSCDLLLRSWEGPLFDKFLPKKRKTISCTLYSTE